MILTALNRSLLSAGSEICCCCADLDDFDTILHERPGYINRELEGHESGWVIFTRRFWASVMSSIGSRSTEAIWPQQVIVNRRNISSEESFCQVSRKRALPIMGYTPLSWVSKLWIEKSSHWRQPSMKCSACPMSCGDLWSCRRSNPRIPRCKKV